MLISLVLIISFLSAFIHLDEVDSKVNSSKCHIYSLTMESLHDTLEIQVNGRTMDYPFIIIKELTA